MDMKKIFFFAFFILMWGLLNTDARAQLGLSPSIIEIQAHAGGFQKFSLSIMNQGEDRLNCEMSVTGMVVVGGGLPVASENAPRGCNDWIQLTPQTFVLPPKSGKGIMCRMNPPKGSSGGYYALISCLARPESAAEEESEGEGTRAAIRFGHKVQAVVMLSVPGSNVRAVVEAGRPMIDLDRNGRGYVVKLPVRNTGNIHERVRGQLEIRSDAGQVIDRFPLSEGRGFLLPEHERLFTSQGVLNIPDGLYLANVMLLLESTKRTLRNTFPFAVSDGQAKLVEVTEELRKKLQQQSAGFLVSPPFLSTIVRPGSRRTQMVEIRNLTMETIPIHAEILEWSRNEFGLDMVRNEAGHGRSAREWLDLRTTDLELRPKVKRRLPLIVSVPRESAGQRYSAVTFHRKDRNLSNSPENLARRSILVQVGAQNTGTAAAEVNQFTVSPLESGVIEFIAEIKNSGNITLTPEIYYKIMDSFNKTVGTKRPEEALSFVQAGGTAQLKMEWREILEPGDYTAELTLRFDPNQPPVIQRKGFTIEQK